MGSERAERNVELAREGLAAYERGEVERVLELFDSEVEVMAAPGLINSGTHQGHDGFLRWLGQWEEAWDEFHAEVQALEPLGERHVLAVVDQTGVGAGSGIEVEMRIAYLFELDGDRVVRFHLYPDREAAETAADRLRG